MNASEEKLPCYDDNYDEDDEDAQDDETIVLLKAIRMRDTQKIGEVVLRMLKAELVAAMRD